MKILLQAIFIILFVVQGTAQSEYIKHIPMDDITARTTLASERPLPYPAIREADILWEKRVWRVIDTREKMNLPFRYPKQSFFSILTNAIQSGELQAYSVEDDAFSIPLNSQDVDKILYRIDTVAIVEPEHYSEHYEIVRNTINPEDIKRYRLKEVWFFDSKRGKLDVRILGIAPLKEEYDDNGNFKYERPLFWVYYPEARQMLHHYRAPNPWNDRSPMSWADVFDMRQFSSYIMKASNLHDRRLEAYTSGRNLLLESRRIEQEIFKLEQDAWQR